MPYVAHYYPASDAGRFFRVGSTIEIAGPLFTTYADAAAQLAQELEDIDAHSLPVSPYILQVEPQRNGFRIVEAFDAEVGSAGRARNPRREGARMTPIGELIGDRVQMYEPRGIEVGPRQQEYEPDAAADVFGSFMADAAPRGVSARRIAHAFHTGITPPKVLEERADQRDAKEKAIEKVARQVDKDVQTLGVTGAIEKSEEKLAAIVEAVESGQITKAEAAVPIAVETKKQEILAILNRFCPTIGEEGTEAIYEVVKATLGGDPDAAEASRVILEKVGKRVTGRPVKVVTGEPKPKGKGKKAVAQIAGGVAPFNGDVTAFVKANGHYFTGMPTGLVGKVIDNALGVSPFPVDHPIAQLRQVSEAAYRLLRDADVFKVSSAFNNEPQELETQIVAFPSEAAAAPLAAVVAEQIAELPPAAQDEVIAEVEEAAAEAEEFEDAGADTHTPAVIEVYRENVDKAISGMSKIAVKQSNNKTDEYAWFAKQKKLQAAQKMLGVRGADSIPPTSYYSRFGWLLNLAEREKELRAQGQTPWWRGGSIGVSFSQLVAQAEAAEAEVPQPGGASKRVFDEAVRIVGLPYREAERALESSSYSFEALYDALEDRNWHTEIRVLQALAAPMRLARPNLWKAATELVAKKDKAGSLTPALRKERDALDEKIAKYQKVEPIVAIEAPAQPLAEVVAEQVAELPRAEREEVAAEVAAAPVKYADTPVAQEYYRSGGAYTKEADGIRGVKVPDALLPSSAGYRKNEFVYGTLKPEWGAGVYQRTNYERSQQIPAWKLSSLPRETLAKIADWASQYFTPDAAEVAAAPAPAPATRIKLPSLGGSYESVPPLDEGAYNRRVEGAVYNLDELTEEVRQMSLEPRGVSMTVMGKAENLKRLLQEARRLSRKPAAGMSVLDELERGIVELRTEIREETVKNEMAAAAERKRAKEIAEASRSSAPAPAAPRSAAEYFASVERQQREAAVAAPVAAVEPDEALLPEGVMQQQVQMPDGSVELRYTVDRFGNDGQPMGSRSIHRTLEDAMKQVALNDRFRSQALANAARIAANRAEAEEIAAARSALVDPALTGIDKARAFRQIDAQKKAAEKAAEKAAFVDPRIAAGGKLWVAFAATENGLIPEYRIQMPNGNFFKITKPEFAKADRGEPIAISTVTRAVGSTILSDSALHALETAARQKYPSIFAREATIPPPSGVPFPLVEPDEADVEFSQFNEPQVAPSRSRRPSAEPRAARAPRAPRATSVAAPALAPTPVPAIISAASAAATAVDDDDAAETARAAQAAAELAVENQKAFAMIQKMFGL